MAYNVIVESAETAIVCPAEYSASFEFAYVDHPENRYPSLIGSTDGIVIVYDNSVPSYVNDDGASLPPLASNDSVNVYVGVG